MRRGGRKVTALARLCLPGSDVGAYTPPMYRTCSLLAACLLVWGCAGDDDPSGPEPPAGSLRFAGIDAGYYHTCALTTTGGAYCWGGNTFGTLGDATLVTRDLPTPVANAPAFTQLDAGAGHNCAVTSAGLAYCWGHNDEGQVGDGTFLQRNFPARVQTSQLLRAVSAGHAHSCGIAADSTAWCWGDDSRGQLGNGSDGGPRSALPVRVTHTLPWRAIYAGYYQTCGIDRSGSAYCWGANAAGQAGNGTTGDLAAPGAPVQGGPYQQLAPGDRFVCGVRSGRVDCWGAIGSGSSTPVQVTGLASVATIAASSGASTVPSTESYACAVRADGTTSCWGGAVRTLRPAGPLPTPLATGVRFTAVAAGAQHVCALDRAGYAWCGGANYSGQLGSGTRLDGATMSPVASNGRG